jgi:hypothetical protein
MPMGLPRHLNKEALGYRIHTNRELGMMLRREKPLAIFTNAGKARSLGHTDTQNDAWIESRYLDQNGAP